PYEDEQEELANCVSELIAEGRSVRQIVLTHRHPDHVGGVHALKAHLQREHNVNVAVAAHQLTAAALQDEVSISQLISDEEVIELAGEPHILLRALHTPRHARGHLCFHEQRTGTLISGDNILGLGSVLIDPPEGNMIDYLASLRRVRELSRLSVIFCGHGPAVANPYSKIDEYIEHRLAREQDILAAVR